MRHLIALVACVSFAAAQTPAADQDPLPSWNKGPNKSAILEFVRAVTTKGSKDYVPPAERIAAFDNDGTLWVEQPIYTETVFSFDRARKLLPKHPEWKKIPLFKTVMTGKPADLRNMDGKQYRELIIATHTGMTTSDYDRIAKRFLATAKHPRYKKRYTKLAYLPQLEVIAFLQQHQFKTYIVSGGGAGFIRSYAGKTYGIPPENVVASTVTLQWKMRDAHPVLMRVAPVFFYNNLAGKPVGIQLHIGRRPLITFGNSDGDLQMLQWTAAGSGQRRMFIVHHDDAQREYKYAAQSPVGRLDKALKIARKKGWNVISMKDDWKHIFAFEQ